MRGRRFAGVGIVALLALPSVASACSCAPQSPANSLRDADGALVGRLVKVIPHGALHAVYRYRVHRVYKGGEAVHAGRMLDVHSARRSAACALPRRPGRAYGLFLRRAHGRWYGGICGVVSPRRLHRAARSSGTASRRAAGSPVLCG